MSKKMKVKILSAVIMIAIVIPPVYLGGNLLLTLELIIAAGIAFETAKLVEQKVSLLGTVLNFLAIAGFMFATEKLFVPMLSLWILLLFLVELARGKVATDSVVYPFVITVLTGLALRALTAVYSGAWTGWMLMLYICLGCFMCDTGAYFFGVSLGKHKMIPAVSPNKTWEGSIGGYFTGMLTSFLFGYFFLKELPVTLLFAGSLVLPLAAQVGDLSFSSIKRRFGIKDFGNLIPEHGGFLDRVDSLIFCLLSMNVLMLLWGVL